MGGAHGYMLSESLRIQQQAVAANRRDLLWPADQHHLAAIVGLPAAVVATHHPSTHHSNPHASLRFIIPAVSSKAGHRIVQPGPCEKQKVVAGDTEIIRQRDGRWHATAARFNWCCCYYSDGKICSTELLLLARFTGAIQTLAPYCTNQYMMLQS